MINDIYLLLDWSEIEIIISVETLFTEILRICCEFCVKPPFKYAFNFYGKTFDLEPHAQNGKSFTNESRKVFAHHLMKRCELVRNGQGSIQGTVWLMTTGIILFHDFSSFFTRSYVLIGSMLNDWQRSVKPGDYIDPFQ